ncbi:MULTISPECIES: LysR family transcriptional regulator [unclassified Inquilinus]|uniref:LysR family transcriptional regulator n=1 Tax=unclassified Inquilinus TaxID=2645927 RepID=UPI003F8F6449
MDRLTAMEAFVRVIETGSFSAAARQLRVGQPAVSKTVAQLENRLGVRLLLRSSHGLTPTEAGQGFYERAKRAIEEADEADLAARGAGTGLSGRLRFSATITFTRMHIIPRLPLFLAGHPALTIEAILDDRVVDLIEEGIDVALRMGALADSTMTARRIGQSRRMVFGTPAYFERAGEPSTPAELTGHPAVVYAQGGGGATWTFRREAAEETVTLKDSVRVTAAEGVREAVFAGLGLCVAAEWMFQPALAQGLVRQVLPDWTLPSIDLWAAFPTGRRASAKARAFADFVEEQLRGTGFGL